MPPRTRRARGCAGLVDLLDRELREGLGREDARVVDQDVDPAEFFRGAPDGGGDLSGIGAVGTEGDSAPSGATNVGGDRFRRLGPRAIGDRDIGSRRGQPPRDRGTDATAATGHQRHRASRLAHLFSHFCVVQYRNTRAVEQPTVKRYI